MKPELATPGMPDWLVGEAAKEWKRVVPLLEEVRVLTELDQSMLAMYCAAHGLAVEATRRYLKEGLLPKAKGLMKHKHPLIKVAQEARAQALRLGAEFGLSPASRTRVASDPKPKDGAKDDSENFLFGPKLTVVNGGEER